jgi:hypothetical protein
MPPEIEAGGDAAAVVGAAARRANDPAAAPANRCRSSAKDGNYEVLDEEGLS